MLNKLFEADMSVEILWFIWFYEEIIFIILLCTDILNFNDSR